MKKLLSLSLLFLMLISLKDLNPQNRLAKVTTNDDYNYIAVNNILMWVANNGDGSHDPTTDGSGFYWPGGEDAVKTAIFQDGLIWGCNLTGGPSVEQKTRVNGNVYRYGLQAGKILDNGEADDPSLEKYRIYKVNRHWRDMQPGPPKEAFKKDHYVWPVEDGAPWVDVDKDGAYDPDIDHPEYTGDEMLWYIANDLDETRSTFTYGSLPIGLEIHTTVFGWNHPGVLNDMVFKRYKFINKSQYNLDSLFFGYWSDPDLGNAGDDAVGCDTTLEMAYCYNGDDDDGVYEEPVPAVGYVLLNDLQMTSYILFIGSSAIYSDPPQGNYWGTTIFYNYLNGQIWNGTPLINPITGDTTKFAIAGDPVSGTGWYEGGPEGWPGGPYPDDRRMMMSSGPYWLGTQDTFEITFAIPIRRGEDRIDSITELRKAAQTANNFADHDFQFPKAPGPVPLNTYPSDRKIKLHWQDEAEDFIAEDYLTDNNFYKFEGYRVWQYADEAGNDPKLLATFDIENGIKQINDYIIIEGLYGEIPVVNGPDQGLQHSLELTHNIYDQERLRNGSPYYFGVTAYAYSKNSAPRILESDPQIITVIPGEQRIDQSYNHALDQFIEGEKLNPTSDGRFLVEVVNPDVVTDHIYKAKAFWSDTTVWSLVDSTTGDTLFSDNRNVKLDADSAYIFDGLKYILHDEGFDSLRGIHGYRYGTRYNYGVRKVCEVANSNGVLENEINVIKNNNSSNEWKITAYGPYVEDIKQNINSVKSDAIGYDYYEIRFTTEEEGSEYYLYGYYASFRGPVTSDLKAKNKVPFQVWNIGRNIDSPEDDVRLKVKIQDSEVGEVDSTKYYPDSVWTRTTAGVWEPIFAWLEPDSAYHDNLPDKLQTQKPWWFPLTDIVIDGELPEPGTIIRIYTWKPIGAGDAFTIQLSSPNENDFAQAKSQLDKISVFPNPYFGSEYRQNVPGQGFVRFTNLPQKTIIRIYTIAGVLVLKEEKDNASPWWDWDLRNQGGIPVASAVFIAHLEMPNIGTKILKVAVVQDNFTILNK